MLRNFAIVDKNNTNMDMNRIKEVLLSKGISQSELARRLGKTFNMVNLYASNKVQPPLPVLYRIAEIVNVDVRELLIPNPVKEKPAFDEGKEGGKPAKSESKQKRARTSPKR